MRRRFCPAFIIVALVATTGACGDNAAELERLRAARTSAKPSKPKTPSNDRKVTPTGDPTTGDLPAGTDPCAPRPPAARAFAWRPPHQLRGSCTDAEANALGACAASNQMCDGAPASTTCRACAITTIGGASTYGALLIDPAKPTKIEINVEGCAAMLLGDTSDAGCGPALVARFHCEEDACARCDDEARKSDCFVQADRTTCASAVNRSAPCMDAAAQCLASGGSDDTAAVAASLVRMFCL